VPAAGPGPVGPRLFNWRPTQWEALGRAYVGALGEAPRSVALPRLEGVFGWLGDLPDTLSTARHYALSRLGVLDAVVLAALQSSGRAATPPGRL